MDIALIAALIPLAIVLALVLHKYAPVIYRWCFPRKSDELRSEIKQMYNELPPEDQAEVDAWLDKRKRNRGQK